MTAPPVITTPLQTVFGTFTNTAVAGTPIQIQVSLLKRAMQEAMQIKDTADTKSLLVFNLAQLYGYQYDYHLSFKADDTGQWAKDCHFCARHEPSGKNACAYWFYELVRTSQGALLWSYKGTAAVNQENAAIMDAIGVLNPGGSPTAARMLGRNATAPLATLLAHLTAKIGKGRAVLNGNQLREV